MVLRWILACLLVAMACACEGDEQAPLEALGGATGAPARERPFDGAGGYSGFSGFQDPMAGSGGADSEPDEELPTHVTVEMVGCLVGVGSGGLNWDGGGTIPDGALQATGAAIGSALPAVGTAAGFAIGTVADEIQRVAAAGHDAPDPRGWAEIDVGLGWAHRLELADAWNNDNDVYQTDWPDSPGWLEVPLDGSARIRVVVEDEENWGNPQAIGTAILTHEDLVEALQSGVVHWVYVGDQTGDQLVAVSILVS